MKAMFKYRDADGDAIAYYRLTDLVRATFEYDTVSAMYSGLEAVVDLFGEDVVELNDRYQAPLGEYRDMQLVVKFQNHLCELQLSTVPFLRAKATTGHRDFEVLRELQAAVACGSLERCVDALEWSCFHARDAPDSTRALLGNLLRADEHPSWNAAADAPRQDAAARGCEAGLRRDRRVSAAARRVGGRAGRSRRHGPPLCRRRRPGSHVVIGGIPGPLPGPKRPSRGIP